MGALKDLIKTDKDLYGKNPVTFYKSNTLYLYPKYAKSDEDCKSVPIKDVVPGGFYFLQYLDDSNWMMYSPIFCVDFKRVNNLLVILAVNFNFIPLEIRADIFDKFILQKDIDENRLLKVNYEGMYSTLLRYGFEYSLVEYNAAQIKYSHRINLKILPRFLYSSHPKNIYDPKKLLEIWTKKLETREQRHQEMIVTVLNEFYDVDNEISEKYSVLEDHIKRLQKSMLKYGS